MNNYNNSSRGNSERGDYSRGGNSQNSYSRNGDNRGGSSRGGSYGSRDRGYRGGNGGNRNQSRRNHKPAKLDISKLIKQASGITEQAEVYVPQNTFDQLDIVRELKDNLVGKGFTNPTPIQDQIIPYILQGKDVVGIANTGTGKTGAFLVPLLDKIAKNHREKVLIIAPTRELAEQIHNEVYALTKSLRINSILCVGGMNMNTQIGKLKSNFNIVVGTPGRLLDLTKRGFMRMEHFNTIVLDEVDRMLDMGFITDIKLIISQLPAERHSLFFSATITPSVENILQMFTADYVKVSVKTAETSDNVHQDVIYVANIEEKKTKLEEMLVLDDFKKVIIFVRTKMSADRLDQHLYSRGFKVDSIHGDKSQMKRKKALDRFKSGTATILVATDVAARGLDVPNISHVINFDMPATYDDYVHRIGRTGRASKIGYAFTFVDGK